MIKNKKKRFVVLLLLVLFALAAIGYYFASIYIDKVSHPIKYQEQVEKYALEYSIDKYLLYAFIRTESGFNPNAQSNVGARGLLQITDETFAWIKSKIARDEDLTFDDMYKFEINIRFGAYYIAKSLEKYNYDVSTAAAAYHSGWGTVDKLLCDDKYSTDKKTLIKFPFEQMNLYVYKINKNYSKYTKLYNEHKGD
ncbi:MAG: lytic transglycosylase domain-containing protein [Oscillospiraceae bacterium]